MMRGRGIAGGAGGASAGVAGASAGEAGLTSAGRIYSPLVDLKIRRMEKIAGLNASGQSVANANINLRVQNADLMRRMSMIESKISVERANLSMTTRPSDRLKSAMDIKSLENRLEANRKALVDNTRMIGENAKIVQSIRGRRADAQGQIGALEKKIESIMNPLKQMSLTEKILGLSAISSLIPLFSSAKSALSPLTAGLTFTGSTLLMFASRISLVTALMYTWYQSFQTMKWNEQKNQNGIDIEAMKTEIVLGRAERLRLKEENINMNSMRGFFKKGFLYDKKTDSGYNVTAKNFPLAFSQTGKEGQRQLTGLSSMLATGKISEKTVIQNLGQEGYDALNPKSFAMNIQGNLNITKMDDEVKKELAEYMTNELIKRRNEFAVKGTVEGKVTKFDAFTNIINDLTTVNTGN
jgi:hypothetical protein